MTNDRFGMLWGLAGGATLASLTEARKVAEFAEKSSFDSFWISQAMGIDAIVALACIGANLPGINEFGTSIVPLFGRHPVGLAQLSRTTQNALNGRFTLGIGTASRRHVTDVLGINWDKPFSYTQEFVNALEPLLAGKQTDLNGEQITAHAKLKIDAQPTPILLAALGPRMLQFAGSRMQGTTLGQCGPRTISNYVLPHLRVGAKRVGRNGPIRIMALVRICVTDDISGAKALAREIAAHYQSNPSYANATKHEGLEDASELHLIGSWQRILDGLGEYARAGATDLRIQVVTHNQKSREKTYDALSDYLT